MLQERTAVLTDRQRQVLFAVAHRLSIKEIAADLDISDTQVNRTIRALKEAIGVNSLSELAQAYRDVIAGADDDSFSVASFSALSRGPSDRGSAPRDAVDADEAGLTLHDVAWTASPPWGLAAPAVVPGTLNGRHAVWVRIALMAAVTCAFFVAITVGLGAYQGVTALLDRSAVPLVH